jgi:ATP-dependent DNA helicase RecQ
MNIYQAVYSLKELEQDGWIAFNEQVFHPSTVQFTCNRDALHEFENANPSLEPFIKTLLRTYAGIYDQHVSVSEKYLTGLARLPEPEVRASLATLHRYGIIEYRPQKDKPQICFLRERVNTADLTINISAYQKRKEVFRDRVQIMLRYLDEDLLCRSRFIGRYFGDHALKNCGVCDICLRQKELHIEKPEFDSINQRITEITREPLPAKELIEKLSGIRKEKAWKVIDHLQAENKLEVDKRGWIRRKT